MKRWIVGCAVLALVISAGTVAEAALVTVRYTADNIIGAFYQDGGSPISVGLGANASDWTKSDTATLSLSAGDSYQLIFLAEQVGAFGTGNPAGLLAEISGAATGDLLSSMNWEYAVYSISNPSPSDFNLLTWAAATEYGNNGGSNIWGNANGTLPGISTSAQWIWNGENFTDTGTEGTLWFRATIQAIPEPASLIIWAVLAGGAAGIGVARKRRRAGPSGRWSNDHREAILGVIEGRAHH